jgi:hypothetical protein
MRFSTHHDAPVAFPDSMRILDATVTRRSRSGDIIGPDQRVDVMTALKAMTIWPAWQHFEEDTKGSIEVGKLADFVILSDDPTAVDREALDTLDVLATIKEDAVVYEAASGTSDGRLPWVPSEAGNGAFARAMQVAALQSELPADMPAMKRRIALKQAERAPHGPTCLSDFVARVLTPAMIGGGTVVR